MKTYLILSMIVTMVTITETAISKNKNPCDKAKNGLDWVLYTELTDKNTKSKVDANAQGVTPPTKEEIGVNLTRFVNKKTYATKYVDPVFYQDYQRMTASLCELYLLVKTKQISSAEGKKRAEDLNLKIVEKFALVPTIPEKEAKHKTEWRDKDEHGVPYTEIWDVSSDCNPCGNGTGMDRTYNLKTPNAQIICVDYTCLNGACGWSYNPDGTFPSEPCPGGDRRPQYGIHYRIINPALNNSFVAKRKWDAPVTERYTVYIKIPVRVLDK